VHAHLPRDVGEHLVPVLELDTEIGVGQRLDDRAFDQDRVVLGLRDGISPPSWFVRVDRTGKSGARQTARAR
jgi:hypothetical protein